MATFRQKKITVPICWCSSQSCPGSMYLSPMYLPDASPLVRTRKRTTVPDSLLKVEPPITDNLSHGGYDLMQYFIMNSTF